MAEQAVNRRKSQLFLTNISPVSNTYDELVRKKLKKGKFPQTKTGIIKMIAMSFQFSSLISWLIITQQCSDWLFAYIYLICTAMGFICQFLLFMLFSFGRTVKDPGIWIRRDIIVNILASVFIILTAVLLLNKCSNNGDMTQKLSEILGICGAVISLLSCVAILLMYRYVEDPEVVVPKPPKPTPVQRKSIYA
ncbi:uncharacterized protein LOC143194861 [Rhynchophorus ferrugineus]|uniref:uncharacterized protein LOC143194861 n=1 Tax=Rhynchophorus ferrugineus TaxID=354439 RepID=UPI003FCEA37C